MKSTRPLTDAQAEKIAKALETRVPGSLIPVGPGPGAVRGRRSLSSGGGVTPKRGIRLPDEVDARYRRKAQQEGIAVSALMRDVLSKHAPRPR